MRRDAPRPIVVVPSMAVRRAAYGNSVFVITPEQDGQTFRAHQRFVTLGETIGEDAVVLEGLAEGDRIAGNGSFKLHDKAKVMMGPPGGPPAANGPAAESGGHAEAPGR
jgi:multidrug efflux pump subunit AcrA (membrane-fusion protein)